MSNYQPISRERHDAKRWQRYSSYGFAAAEVVVPLTVAELSKAVISLPIGFIADGEGFLPAAVLGLLPGKNLFVALDGRWAGRYIPAVFRAYPFRLAKTEEGQQILCIDEDSGLVTAGPAGESFFAGDGQPAQAILDIINFLNMVEQSRMATVAACTVLREHNLIRPWPITLKTAAGERQIAGLFQTDEALLNQLSAEALFEVHRSGALTIAYCQLLSMQHLPVLGELTEAHAKVAAQSQAAQPTPSSGNPNLDLISKDGVISFSNWD